MASLGRFSRVRARPLASLDPGHGLVAAKGDSARRAQGQSPGNWVSSAAWLRAGMPVIPGAFVRNNERRWAKMQLHWAATLSFSSSVLMPMAHLDASLDWREDESAERVCRRVGRSEPTQIDEDGKASDDPCADQNE
jgi:hypothetical protein